MIAATDRVAVMQPTRALSARIVRDDGERADRVDRLLFELDSCVGDVVQAPLWIFLEASSQQPPDARGVAAGSARQSGSRSRIAATVSDTVSPANARRPVNISYSTHPNAQMSVRLSTGWPRACSGLM